LSQDPVVDIGINTSPYRGTGAGEVDNWVAVRIGWDPEIAIRFDF
jgi:hypothetical protein